MGLDTQWLLTVGGTHGTFRNLQELLVFNMWRMEVLNPLQCVGQPYTMNCSAPVLTEPPFRNTGLDGGWWWWGLLFFSLSS